MPERPIPVQSETLRALMHEGRREWFLVEPWFYLLLLLIAVDIVLGLVWAYRREDIASGAFFDGLKKKTSMILVIGSLIVIDPFAPGITLSIIATVAYVVMEALSITETAAKLGAPVPESVTRILRAMRAPEPTPVRIVNQATVTISNPPNDPVPVTTKTGDE